MELPLHTLIELEGTTEVSSANASFDRSIFSTYVESDNKESLIFLVLDPHWVVWQFSVGKILGTVVSQWKDLTLDHRVLYDLRMPCFWDDSDVCFT